MLLEVQGISVSFDGFKAINNLSFNIGPAELRAIIGPNGAGKTTFMDIVTGKTRADSGDVTWGSKNVSLLKKSEHEIASMGIGRKFQRPTVFEEQTVTDNLMMALRNKRGPLDALFYAFSNDDQERVQETAEEIGLKDHTDRLAGELSHGQKQWLEIGMALTMQPKVLLLDEPTAGLSADETSATAKFLRGLVGKVTVVVIEHDMAFVRELGARTIVLHHGEVIASGPFSEIENNEFVRDVYLGRR